MPSSTSQSAYFLLFLLISSAYISVSSEYFERSSDAADEFIPLPQMRRAKRQAPTTPAGSRGAKEDDLLEMNGGTFPPDYEVEDENKEEESKKDGATELVGRRGGGGIGIGGGATDKRRGLKFNHCSD